MRQFENAYSQWRYNWNFFGQKKNTNKLFVTIAISDLLMGNAHDLRICHFSLQHSARNKSIPLVT